MLRKLMLTAAFVVAVGGVLVLPVQPASASSHRHCPDHNTQGVNKINSSSGDETVNGVNVVWSGDPGSVTLTNNNSEAAVIKWCAKGGQNFWQGGFHTDKVKTNLSAGETKTVEFDQEVSYFVIYKVKVEEPSEPQPVIPVNGDDEDEEKEADKEVKEEAEKEVEQVDAPKVAAVDAGAGPAVGSAVLGLFTSLTAVVGVATRKLSAIFES